MSGKVRGKRYRLHASAPKLKQTDSEIEEIPQLYIQKNVPSMSNIFKNIVIPPTVLKQSLPSYSKKDLRNLEVRGVIHNCDIRDAGRARRKKIPFHEVVTSAKAFLKKREKEKKKGVGILGNFQALQEALPDLDQLVEKKKREDNKPRAAKRFSAQQDEMMKDLLTFQEVLANPEYVRNPIASITDQLRKRIESGRL